VPRPPGCSEPVAGRQLSNTWSTLGHGQPFRCSVAYPCSWCYCPPTSCFKSVLPRLPWPPCLPRTLPQLGGADGSPALCGWQVCMADPMHSSQSPPAQPRRSRQKRARNTVSESGDGSGTASGEGGAGLSAAMFHAAGVVDAASNPEVGAHIAAVQEYRTQHHASPAECLTSYAEALNMPAAAIVGITPAAAAASATLTCIERAMNDVWHAVQPLRESTGPPLLVGDQPQRALVAASLRERLQKLKPSAAHTLFVRLIADTGAPAAARVSRSRGAATARATRHASPYTDGVTARVVGFARRRRSGLL